MVGYCTQLHVMNGRRGICIRRWLPIRELSVDRGGGNSHFMAFLSRHNETGDTQRQIVHVYAARPATGHGLLPMQTVKYRTDGRLEEEAIVYDLEAGDLIQILLTK